MKLNNNQTPTGFSSMHKLFNKRRLYVLISMCILSIVTPAHSFGEGEDTFPLIVVVNLNSTIESVTDRELRKLFMGKSRKLSNGSRAVLASFGPASSAFNRAALARSDSDVTAAWARLKFSGKTKPPREFSSPDELLAFVANTPNAIAYLPANLNSEGFVKTVRAIP